MRRSIKTPFFLLALILFLSACGADGSRYYLISKGGRGIDEGAQIFYNGVEVGEVEEVAVNGQKVKITLVIDEKVKIGKTAVFGTRMKGFFKSSVTIEGGNDTEFYKPGSYIYQDIESTNIFSALQEIAKEADSTNRANMSATDTLEVIRIGSYASGRTKYSVYTYFNNGVSSTSFAGDAHVVFTSSNDTIVYELDSPLELPYKFDGKYFFSGNGRSLFNGFNEDLCLKSGCYEQSYPDLTLFREGL